MGSWLKQEFRGFKIGNMVDQPGFRVECRQCFLPERSGWRRPSASVESIPALRRWVETHEHLLPFEQAMAECLVAAGRGHKRAKQWLSSHRLTRPAPAKPVIPLPNALERLTDE